MSEKLLGPAVHEIDVVSITNVQEFQFSRIIVDSKLEHEELYHSCTEVGMELNHSWSWKLEIVLEK